MPDENLSPKEEPKTIEETSGLDEIIIDKIVKNNPVLFNGIEDDRRKEIISQVLRVSQGFSFSISKTHIGPLPDPNTLDGYNKVVTGGAERIFTEFEKQGNHRRDIEKQVIKCDNALGVSGQIMAFLLAIGFGIAGFYLVVNGYDIAGTFLLTIDIVGLAGVFIVGRHWQKKARTEVKE